LKSVRWAIWLTCFLVCGLLVIIFGVGYSVAGSISGTEFDAVNWKTRHFRFMRDPFSDAQLSNVKHSGTGDFTVDKIIANHIIGGAARPVYPRWDLVRMFRGTSHGEGEALILLEYLEARSSSGSNFWVEWTTDHPQAAPILWSGVRDAVHLQRYDRLPEIFDLVRVDADPKRLKAAMAKTMITLALEEAQAQAAAGERAAAARAARVGLDYGQSDELRALSKMDESPK
jgi:hypothetical protein